MIIESYTASVLEAIFHSDIQGDFVARFVNTVLNCHS